LLPGQTAEKPGVIFFDLRGPFTIVIEQSLYFFHNVSLQLASGKS
jgi:hypothetical protein